MPIELARRAGRAKLRLAIGGPAKHGKSLTALMIARGLINYLAERGELPGSPMQQGYGRIGVIDTEHYSSLKYAKVDDDDDRLDAFDFDVENFPSPGPYSPENYIAKLNEFERFGYSVVIIDQLSHEWEGLGGILEIHQKLCEEVRKSNPKNAVNTYAMWGKVTPRHRALVERWNSSPCHIIGIFRAKIKYQLNSKAERPEQRVVKLGTRIIGQKQTDFEFDAFSMMQRDEKRDHIMTFDGIREGLTKVFGHQSFVNPSDTLGQMFGEWLSRGKIVTEAERDMLDSFTVNQISGLIREAGLTNDEVLLSLTERGVSRVNELSQTAAQEVIQSLKTLIKRSKAQAARQAIAEPSPEAEAATSDAGLVSDNEVDEDAMPSSSKIVRYPNGKPPEKAPKTVAKRDQDLPGQTSFLKSETEDLGDALADQLIEQSKDIIPAIYNGNSIDLGKPDGREIAYDYSSNLAEVIGYDLERFQEHLTARGAKQNDPTYYDLSNSQLKLFIADLEEILADKKENPDEFDLDLWEIYPD